MLKQTFEKELYTSVLNRWIKEKADINNFINKETLRNQHLKRFIELYAQLDTLNETTVSDEELYSQIENINSIDSFDKAAKQAIINIWNSKDRTDELLYVLHDVTYLSAKLRIFYHYTDINKENIFDTTKKLLKHLYKNYYQWNTKLIKNEFDNLLEDEE